ncbi:MAG: OmpH family outer membrane protein [Kordiimonadaceae bacterium]|nr:OmpH family outer membrane protein [Kordiimonadaceae bacterium]
MTFLATLTRSFSFAIVAITLSATAASAQVLIVDNERIEREAAAYKDFNFQANNVREKIVERRQYIARGGTLEGLLADLERQKADLGDEKYEQQKQALEITYTRFQRELRELELTFDQLLQEARLQLERARRPVIKKILEEHGAQVILAKRLVMGNIAGLDVTTQFIELLDAELPTVTLTKLPKP